MFPRCFLSRLSVSSLRVPQGRRACSPTTIAATFAVASDEPVLTLDGSTTH
ncbi:hypothetical protein [Sorangium sp. So ce1151]|uniref:hypothetical protein n=1 Tax=Sorangium sp. So ce1151 TaxID=3133332 RepID=UPI003F62CA8F